MPDTTGPMPAQAAADPLAPISTEAFGVEQARHLLWRAGFGGTPAQIRALGEMGPHRAVDYLLGYASVAYEPDEPGRFDADVMRPPNEEERRILRVARSSRDEATLTRARVERQQRERLDRQQLRRMQEWWLARMISTPRPLEEKMTLFWHGHFATGYRTIEDSYHMYQQNRLFRAHATGSFEALTRAIIRDPAMLAYLDNNESRKEEPNENLARELMELFTLGEGNYTEADIKEGARALTGYGFDDDAFVLRNANHDQGIKTILGVQGRLDGDGFVSAILRRPECSRFIASKLYAYFCKDAAFVDRDQDGATRVITRRLAQTLVRSGWEVAPVLRQLFLSRHFYDAGVVGEHVKSPVELVVGAVRSLNAPVRDLALLNDALALMGQALFQPPNVKGWPGGRAWISTSTLFTRQNTVAFLLTGRTPTGARPGAEYDPMGALGGLVDARASVEDAARAVAGFTLGRPSDRAVRELAALGDGRDVSPALVTGMLLLASSMPEYQLC